MNFPLSLEDLSHCIASFGWSWPFICWLCRPLIECLSHQTPPKSSVSCDNQNSTVQGCSPHKCGQRVWWGALNVVATTIAPITSTLIPFLKFFLYSVAPFGNVPLTWPGLASLASSFRCIDSPKLYWPTRPWVWHVTLLPY